MRVFATRYEDFLVRSTTESIPSTVALTPMRLLRAAEKIDYPVSSPSSILRSVNGASLHHSSGNLRAIFNHKILKLAQLVLRYCSIKSSKSYPNRNVIFGQIFFSAALTGPFAAYPGFPTPFAHARSSLWPAHRSGPDCMPPARWP